MGIFKEFRPLTSITLRASITHLRPNTPSFRNWCTIRRIHIPIHRTIGTLYPSASSAFYPKRYISFYSPSSFSIPSAESIERLARKLKINMGESHTRRDQLLSIERAVQQKWEAAHFFEVDAAELPRDPNSKYLATFPYPYMNGALHLGHAFTLAKVDFQCGYQRLKGKHVLFPFGFHATGMPIAACADKLKRELETFGNPPVFPPESTDDAEDLPKIENLSTSDAPTDQPAPKRKAKAKVAKKSSKEVYQWNILKEMGVPENEIAKFANAKHWLYYFPPLAIHDLKAFGVGIDFRRSFITTEVNPYYDAFIRWQYHTLRKKDKVAFGDRLSIFSPIDNQNCADHDRAEGEGVGLTDYTLILIKLMAPYPTSLSTILGDHGNKPVYLPAATLRPETMYGQTNVFLLPEGEYGVFEMINDSIFICSQRSAKNMAYQKLTRAQGQVDQLGCILGSELLGCKVTAPLCTYPHVYVLPLTTIKMDKGTGVVTSVPSDAPDDYAALMDLKNKPPFRAKYNLTDEMVLPFDVVPIINTPELGTTPAADLCIQAKVSSQNDRAKLELIKDRVYKEGFAKGVMIVGDYKDVKVSDAKPKIKADLIAAGKAYAYSEPESRVMSRSGNECVAAYSPQWYLKYGEEHWQGLVRNHVENTLETYNPQAKKDFLSTVEWLREWALSRSYGLGTFLPWDPQYVIESLSDSTIYMAYYTIAHFLQNGTLDGKSDTPNKLRPEDLTEDVFNYIFLHDQFPNPPNSAISRETLDKMRHEFEFWYPMDIRVSGKDLINNHLTMAIYHHAAIWENRPDLWPRSFFTNGHVMVDAEKMSKSKGNFITIAQAVAMYGADATRLALADSGDSLDDANFETKAVNASILKLTKEEAWLKKEILPALAVPNALRTGDYTFMDRVFQMQINDCIRLADEGYSRLVYRDAAKGSFHELLSVRDNYRLHAEVMHRDLVQYYIQVSIILLSPLCPHFAQHMWELAQLDKQTGIPFVGRARFPEVTPSNPLLARQISYLRDTNTFIRRSYADQISKMTKSKGKSKDIKQVADAVDISSLDSIVLYVATEYPPWQQTILRILLDLYNRSTSPTKTPERKDIISALKAEFGSDKKQFENANKFATSVLEDLQVRGVDALELQLPFDEITLLRDQTAFALREIPLKNCEIKSVSDLTPDLPEVVRNTAVKALPGRPAAYIYSQQQ